MNLLGLTFCFDPVPSYVSIYKSPLERHSAHFLRGKEGEVRLSNFIFGFVSFFFSKIKLKICGTINMMNTTA